jgi:hypothetical protein
MRLAGRSFIPFLHEKLGGAAVISQVPSQSTPLHITLWEYKSIKLVE